MTGAYRPELVALSLIIAVFASYTALELAGRVRTKRSRHGKSALLWLLGGAFAMGTGIWSMHFIGMLAFHLPIPVDYDAGITLISLIIAIGAAALAMIVVSREELGTWSLSIGAVMMGLGIAAMHYTGMLAMRMSPQIHYQPTLFMASIVIAIAASLAALRLAFQLRDNSFGVAILLKLGSALLMGIAITGMHYTGMAAAEFAPNAICRVGTASVGNFALAVTVGISTFLILTIALGVSALDAHLATRLASALQQTNQQLSSLALYDSLTGLPNRMLLDDRIGEAASQAERSKESFALLFVDLDRFKPVNDTFGHQIGDLLLKAVAERLRACVRASDTVARTGGDEFVVVLNGIGEPQDAAMVSSKILDELSRPFFIDGYELDVSGSIGISIYPKDGKDPNALKANADRAMYLAKRSGRNNYRFFQPDMLPSGGG